MQWVRQPLRDINAINERHDIVEALFKDTEVRQELHDTHLRRIPDFQSLAKKLRCNKATIQDCYRFILFTRLAFLILDEVRFLQFRSSFRIYYGITQLPSLISTLKSCNDQNPHSTLQNVFITCLEEQIEDTSKYTEMIETTLDLNLVDRGEFLIKPDFDEELESKCYVA
jgi:DNA mismatch repair protein MSH2